MRSEEALRTKGVRDRKERKRQDREAARLAAQWVSLVCASCPRLCCCLAHMLWPSSCHCTGEGATVVPGAHVLRQVLPEGGCLAARVKHGGWRRAREVHPAPRTGSPACAQHLAHPGPGFGRGKPWVDESGPVAAQRGHGSLQHRAACRLSAHVMCTPCRGHSWASHGSWRAHVRHWPGGRGSTQQIHVSRAEPESPSPQTLQ